MPAEEQDDSGLDPARWPPAEVSKCCACKQRCICILSHYKALKDGKTLYLLKVSLSVVIQNNGVIAAWLLFSEVCLCH